MRLTQFGLSGVAAALVLSIGAGCGSNEPAMMMEAKLNQKLVGTWKSSSCELGIMASLTLPVSIYYQREYKFTETDWTATASVFVDPLCATTVVKTTVKGTYTVGAMTSAPTGANEIDLSYAERRLQLLQPTGAQLLNGIMCGGMASWTAGPDVDISTKGCMPLMPSNVDCPKEYDVAKLDGTNLTLGTRPMSPDGLCKSRPTTLSTTALVKQ